MRKLQIGVVAVVAAVGIGVGLHFIFPPSYVGICTNTKTQVRLPDRNCEPIRDANMDWVYYNSGRIIPAVGQQAEDGSASVPDGDNVTRGGVPAQGELEDNGDTGDSSGGGGGGTKSGGGGTKSGGGGGEGGDEGE